MLEKFGAILATVAVAVSPLMEDTVATVANQAPLLGRPAAKVAGFTHQLLPPTSQSSPLPGHPGYQHGAKPWPPGVWG